MVQVTCNSNFKTLKVAKFLINGHQIKQALARVLARTISTIDDGSRNRWTSNQFSIVVDLWMANHTDIHS
ncbi:Uncharacterised protein [Streptococcus pneumoniae]|nr:Uncharacterised protein [Streptococcus pneumoniae]